MNVLFSLHILQGSFRGLLNYYYLVLEAQRSRGTPYLKKTKHTQTIIFKVDTESQEEKKSTEILDHNYHPTSNH